LELQLDLPHPAKRTETFYREKGGEDDGSGRRDGPVQKGAWDRERGGEKSRKVQRKGGNRRTALVRCPMGARMKGRPQSDGRGDDRKEEALTPNGRAGLMTLGAGLCPSDRG